MNQTFEKILNTKFDLKQFPNLKGISDEVNVLKKAITEANEKQDINAAEYGLAELRSYTISEQKRLFEAQKDLTNEINNYWNFTFGLIGLACLISFTLAIVGVFVYRSRKKITLLQTRNALFMKSIQDCVIVCDTHGKVVEYNASVQKIFGYNPTEAIGFSIDKFYGNEGDWQKASSEIDSTNYFKAEIILKRKSGEEFLSYLSANAIYDDKGVRIGTMSISRDITEMKGAYNTIYEQNLEISQSILYAKNIQESTLPTKEEVSSIFPESFVFYRAKDVLSGDLYIFESVLGDNDSLWPAFIVGDCTGHGVPGGVLSLLCSGLLTESLTSPKVNSPAEALDFVRSKLIRLFRSNPSKYILDGMDAAFCVLNREDMVLNFAGANLTCYVVRAEEVLEYKGDKQPVGYSSEMEPFVNYTIKIEEGDIIYLTTDGYVDQFGGPLNKKFLRKRFTKLLLDIKDLPMADQRYRIEKQFFDWKGDIDQTDDIALIAVKI